MERMNSDGGSSIRKRLLTISSNRSNQTYDDFDSVSDSVAGDSGDRSLPSRRFSESNNVPSDALQNEMHRLHPNSNVTPFSTNTIVASQYSKLELDYVSCMSHLAVFGILGATTKWEPLENYNYNKEEINKVIHATQSLHAI